MVSFQVFNGFHGWMINCKSIIQFDDFRVTNNPVSQEVHNSEVLRCRRGATATGRMEGLMTQCSNNSGTS